MRETIGLTNQTLDETHQIARSASEHVNRKDATLKANALLSRRDFGVAAYCGMFLSTGSNAVMSNERLISWPTPNGMRPKCMQYPGPHCDDIFAYMKLGSREIRIPGPYVGKYVPETPAVVRQFSLDTGFCAFLYPSGNSITADRWNGRMFQAPDNELTTVRIHRWQYLDEYDQNFRIPPRDEGVLNIPPIYPNPPLIDEPMLTERGRSFRYADPQIVDHDRGIFAQVTFDFAHRNEVRKIWDMFLNFENSWRVK
jgi:hypothetical protein